jgi:hypothetical protein
MLILWHRLFRCDDLCDSGYALRCGAIREVIAFGETGLLVLTGVISGLASSFDLLASGPGMQTEVGTRCKGKVLEKFGGVEAVGVPIRAVIEASA